jgi:hypothetical protein
MRSTSRKFYLFGLAVVRAPPTSTSTTAATAKIGVREFLVKPNGYRPSFGRQAWLSWQDTACGKVESAPSVQNDSSSSESGVYKASDHQLLEVVHKVGAHLPDVPETGFAVEGAFLLAG